MSEQMTALLRSPAILPSQTSLQPSAKCFQQPLRDSVSRYVQQGRNRDEMRWVPIRCMLHQGSCKYKTYSKLCADARAEQDRLMNCKYRPQTKLRLISCAQ